MKKLSHRDLIIALGILVAAVIIVTSVYFKDANVETNSVKAAPKKIKPAAILKTVVKKFSSRISL
ncbi:MAG: hypothetical protein HYR67_14705 [Bacteroidetes bacterium]|nr:hypothetical protein [Bacteroidota bacterium]